jgi:hypothetical protein
MDFLIGVTFFVCVTFLIAFPVWLRHRLYARQLEAISIAIEKGVDPAVIKKNLTITNGGGDVNGNWKASMILIGLGITLAVVLLPIGIYGAVVEGEVQAIFGILIPGVLLIVTGVILKYIHRRIVGKVVPYQKHHTNPQPEGANE